MEQRTVANIVQPLTFYADGYPGLIFQQTEKGYFLYNQVKKMPSLFLHGQTVQPVEFLPAGSYKVIIFVLYPQVLKSLFNIRASELTDTCIDVSLLPIANVHSIIEELRNAADTTDQVRSINELLLGLSVINERKIESSIQHAIMHLSTNSANVSLEQLRTSLKITERTFERKFEQYVGVSPRLFLRICRFRDSLQQINRKKFAKLSDVAYENGYADQSHFIRTFKEFTGLSPFEYHKLQAATKDIHIPN